jgi:hypothetical protein
MVKPLFKDSYLAVIKNAVGSNMFRNFYAEVNGEKRDILEDGNISCAIFVSTVLLMFKFISAAHVTVKSTVKDMLNNGWYEISEPRVGAVLHWESVDFGKGNMHEHIGFYIGNDKAISNNPELGYPLEHSFDYDGKRKIEKIYWNDNLN